MDSTGFEINNNNNARTLNIVQGGATDPDPSLPTLLKVQIRRFSTKIGTTTIFGTRIKKMTVATTIDDGEWGSS